MKQVERVAFSLYREFIRNGVGTCMVNVIGTTRIPETPDEACLRRWRQLPEKTRNSFIAEARIALSNY